MVPSTYDAYFGAVATAAAALIGLLFVAISIRDETIFGSQARPGGEALAITAFTGLVNSLAIALLALVPGANVGIAAVVLATISIITIIRLNNRLHAARNPLVLVITLAAYGAQLGYGIVLILHPRETADLPDLAYILFVTLLVSLQRAWSLVRGRHLSGGPADSGPLGRAASRFGAPPDQAGGPQPSGPPAGAQ